MISSMPNGQRGYLQPYKDIIRSIANIRRDSMYKNINKQEVLSLKEQIAYQEGQVVSKTLVQN